MSNKKEILDQATAEMIVEFLALANNPAGIPLQTVPDAYDMTISQFIEAFGQMSGNPTMNAVPANIMYQLAEIFTKSNLNRNGFQNRCLTWMNPAQMRGIVADCMAALKGAFRKPASRTSFIAIAKGNPGTIIYASSQIQNEAPQQLESFVYFNLAEAIIGNNGTVQIKFYCEDFGVVPLTKGTKFDIKTSIDGWISVEMDNTQEVSIGNVETTDDELMNSSDITMYQYSRNGYKSILADIDAQLKYPPNTAASVVKAANTAINPKNEIVSLPYMQKRSNIYQIPSCCIVVAVLWADISSVNEQTLGEILFNNIDGANTEYPVNCPTANKREVNINVSEKSSVTNFYNFRYVVAEPILIYFVITYQSSGVIDEDLNKQIRDAIINIFNHGSTNYEPVLMGETFGIQQFRDAVAPLGLPPYTMDMHLLNGASQEYICTPIWLQPTVNEGSISINGV
jgi:hypothetical protein